MSQQKPLHYEYDFNSFKPSVETEHQQQQRTILIVDDSLEDRETDRCYLLQNLELRRRGKSRMVSEGRLPTSKYLGKYLEKFSK